VSGYRIGAPAAIQAAPRHLRPLLWQLWSYASGEAAAAYLRAVEAGEAADGPAVWPSRARLCEEIGVAARTLERQLTELYRLGWIARVDLVINGALVQARRLHIPTGGHDTHDGPPSTADTTPTSGRHRRRDPSPTTGGGPVTDDGSITPENTPITDLVARLSGIPSATRADDVRPPDLEVSAAPLTLALVEPDRVDLDELAGYLARICADARKRLGSPAAARLGRKTTAKLAAYLARAGDRVVIPTAHGVLAKAPHVDAEARELLALVVGRKERSLALRRNRAASAKWCSPDHILDEIDALIASPEYDGDSGPPGSAAANTEGVMFDD